MVNDLILEIGTEELPPSCTRAGLKSLRENLDKKLTEDHIKFKSISVYNSPRRLAAHVEDISMVQDTVEKTVTGPPIKVAYDARGRPNEAAAGFARSLGLDTGDLEEIEIEGKGVYLGKRIVQKGKKTSDILPGLLKDTILSISFNKQMYWGDYGTRFVRPIRWLLALLGSKIIKFDIENVSSGNITFGHRTLKTSPIEIGSTEEYFNKLESQGYVIVDPAERERLIYEQVGKIEKDLWHNKRKAVIHKKLLCDVVDLVEIPNVLIGSFPEEFLYIPADILTEAIQYHQKYFPVTDNKGKITTDFIIVQNGLADNGSIQKGNERVLKARLSDASFFYEQDKRHDFDFWEEKLKGVIFYSGLGNMNDKQNRLYGISSYLVKALGMDKDDKITGYLKQSSLMCKCDLVTNMVVEFPELQGTVGKEYARERGFDSRVSDAIYEHYLPGSAEDILPSTDTGRILSIADRADTITGMFLVGNIPSGSEDPFALRRRAAGMARIILDSRYDISIKDLIGFCTRQYTESFGIKEAGAGLTQEIFEFIQARQRFTMAERGNRMDVLDAVLGSGSSSLLDISLRCDAIWKYMGQNDIKSIVWPMSRSVNIIKGKKSGPVDTGLFRERYEDSLYRDMLQIEEKISDLLEKRKYADILKTLEKFGKTVDTFFDEVLVMDRDDDVRNNRINLLNRVADLYLGMADFSRIVIESDMK